ncbi:hypothetical protein DOTSEDRAFT_73226, partial [Dothistroma septosporum NZE10]
MSRPGGFHFQEKFMPPPGGPGRGLAAAPDDEPNSTRTWNSITNDSFRMYAGSQLVPVVRRNEVSERERQAYQLGPAHQDPEDSDEDDFHDAHEDPDFDLFNSEGEHPIAAPPREQGYQSFEFPQAFAAHTNQNAAFQPQPQQPNGLEYAMDLTGDDSEHADAGYEAKEADFDQFALPDGDFRDLGFDLNQHRGDEEEQQPAQGQEYQVDGGFSFNEVPRQYQEDNLYGDDVPNEQPQQYQGVRINATRPSPEQSHNTISQDSCDQDTEMADTPNAPQEEDDLFGNTFGAIRDEVADADSDIEEVDSATFTATLKSKRLAVDASEANRGIQQRSSTPPLPTGFSHKDLARPSPPHRQRDHPAKDVYGRPWNGRNKPGPDVDRDLSPFLRAHFRFHTRVYDLVPRVPNWEDLDWNRRYWIAVLLEGKKAKTANSERDFVWMKGNRFSTVRTVTEKFLQTTLGDRSSVLMMGHELVQPQDTMEELDYFGDRLCVFRVLPAEHR